MKTVQSPIVLIVGTRPEGIKMMPLYFALKRENIPVILCSTMQHDHLLTEVLELFNIQPDVDLGIMRLGQDLFYVTQSVLQKTKELFSRIQPSLVLVQGDTTSSMAAALAAFYLRIPIGHVEAGLRTDDINAPFPEEMNRRLIGLIATYHFAPTPLAMAHILKEGTPSTNVFCTGNTVVDALRIVKEKIINKTVSLRPDILQHLMRCKQEGRKIILLTIHRRESFGEGILEVLTTVKQFLQKHPDAYCFYPFHPNPHVIQALQTVGLSHLTNLSICEPLAYKDLIGILMQADLVLTDSGGIQEEAVSLGKTVLVLREKTERQEGCWTGLAHLVGTHGETIANHIERFLLQPSSATFPQQAVYGDGYAAEKIVSILLSTSLRSLQKTDKKQAVANMVPAFPLQGISMYKVTICGLGYIGLPTALIAAQAGLEVTGFDIDPVRVQKINDGDPVIQEPEIYEKLQLSKSTHNFRATTTIEAADFFVIAVPTPFYNDKSADLSYVMAATEAIASVLKQGDTVILESTVPVATTTTIAQYLATKTGLKIGTDFYVAHCPERVLPGNIFYELIHNDRIIGGIDQASAHKAAILYKCFAQGKLYLTNDTTAEMVKLVENSSRDVQIAFANQVASMAYAVGLNPFEVIELANKHPRVKILQPSCGVGGHCIAIDPWFLVKSFPEHSQLLQAARHVNDTKPHQVIAAIQKAIEQHSTPTRRCTVLLLGLTYKPDVDDIRESPALAIATELIENTTSTLYVCEPHINKHKLSPHLAEHMINVTEGVLQADIVVYLVNHTRFKAIDSKLLHTKTVLDFCGALHTTQPETNQQEYLFWPALPHPQTPYTHHSLNTIKEDRL